MNLLRCFFPWAASLKSRIKICTYCSCSSLVELDGTYYCPGCSTYLVLGNEGNLEPVDISAFNSAITTEKVGATRGGSRVTSEVSLTSERLSPSKTTLSTSTKKPLSSSSTPMIESSCLCAMCRESEHRAYVERRRREREREVAGLEIEAVQKNSMKNSLRSQTGIYSVFQNVPKRQMIDDVKYCSSCVERINQKLLDDAEKNYPEYAKYLQRARIRSISFVIAGALSYFLFSSGVSFYLHLFLLFLSKNGWFLIPLFFLFFPSGPEWVIPFQSFIYPIWVLLVTGSILITTRKKTVRFIETHSDLDGISERVLKDLSHVRISGSTTVNTGDIHIRKSKENVLMQKKTQIRIREESESKEITRICELLSRLTIQQGIWSKGVSRIKEWALARTPNQSSNDKC